MTDSYWNVGGLKSLATVKWLRYLYKCKHLKKLNYYISDLTEM